MKVLKSYYRGIKEATSQAKMIFILWLANFAFGSVIFYLFFGAFSRAMGNSAVAEGLLKRFDFNFLVEFMSNHGESIATIFSSIVVLTLLYLLVSTFLFGGILFSLTLRLKSSHLAGDERKFVQIFFQGAGKFFGRFFRLLVYSLLLWIASLIILFLVNLFISLFAGREASEKLFFYTLWVRLGIALFIFFLVRMILDYTRIKIAFEDSPKVFRSLLEMTKYVLKKLGKTLALYYLLLLTGVVFFAVLRTLKLIIPQNSFLTITVAFLVGQVFIASQAWLRIAFQQAQLVFYSPGHQEPPESSSRESKNESSQP
jgi:hypothetical protein